MDMDLILLENFEALANRGPYNEKYGSSLKWEQLCGMNV